MSHLNPAGAYPQAYHIALDLDAVDFEDPDLRVWQAESGDVGDHLDRMAFERELETTGGPPAPGELPW